jgi:acyl carrier protein
MVCVTVRGGKCNYIAVKGKKGNIMADARQDVYAVLVEMVAKQLAIDANQIKVGATLENLGVDSLDRVELIMQIEEKFGVALDDVTAEKLETVDQFVDYVHSLI